MLTLRRTIVAVVGVLVVAVVGLAPGAATAAVVRPVGPLSLATGSYFGALVNPDRSTPSSTLAEVTALEAEAGRKLDIVNHFYTYNQAVGTQGEAQDLAGGRYPMVTWGATDTSAINNGSTDAYLTAQANRLKNLGGPVFFRYYHEPDGSYRNAITHTPTAYINAWKHARAVFKAAGATNVIWVWCTTTATFRVVPSTPPWAYYPGDANVDWIAADGYNFAPGKPGAKWLSFQTLFGKWYTWAAAHPVPMMAAEYGVMEDSSSPDRKAAWYNDMRASIKANMPLLQGVVAWSTTNTKDGNVYNWNVDSSPASLAAWSAMGLDPYYNQRRL